MMSSTEHGYIMTDEEIVTLFGNMGIKSLRGLPIDNAELDKDSELEAVRNLLHKGIIRCEGGEYFVNEPFKSAALGVAESRYAVMLFSKNYSGTAFVCYKMQNGISVWEYNTTAEGRYTLYFTDRDAFIEKLTADEFIPPVSEYCRNIPGSYDRDIRSALEQYIENGERTSPRIYFLMKQLDIENRGEQRYILLACGKNGSIVSDIRNDEKPIDLPYKHSEFIGLMKRLLGGEEVYL